jgi:hypothetical protein
MEKLELSKNKILWQVYVAWFLRRILPIVVAQLLLIALAVRIFARNVFVSRVLQNVSLVAESGYWAVLKYLMLSFWATKPLTQLAILLIVAVVALLIRDIGKSFLAYKTMWLRK